jgi:hypothetical protein
MLAQRSSSFLLRRGFFVDGVKLLAVYVKDVIFLVSYEQVSLVFRDIVLECRKPSAFGEVGWL